MSELVPVLTPTELIETIVRAFVDFPEQVSVEEVVSSDRGSILFLRVDAADSGKVIGEQRRMEKSLQDILRAESVRLRHRYALKIIDDFDVDNV
ncbi:MAG: KH domain-containing protein [Acidobacteriaceae bacterium]